VCQRPKADIHGRSASESPVNCNAAYTPSFLDSTNGISSGAFFLMRVRRSSCIGLAPVTFAACAIALPDSTLASHEARC
jgi:hypothetical protein